MNGTEIKLDYKPSSNPSAFIIDFSNGRLDVDNPKCIQPKFTLYEPKNASGAAKRKRVLMAETEFMTYMGRNFGPDRPPEDLCRNLVGVLDKGSGVMTLHDATEMTLHPMTCLKEETETEDEGDEGDEESFQSKRARLIESFGSRKQKRVAHQRDGGRMKDAALKSVLEETRQHREDRSDGHDEENLLESQTRFIPPFDAHAEKAEDVFKLDDIISPVAMEELKEASKAFRKATRVDVSEWRSSKKYSDYVLNHLDVLGTVGSSSVKKKRSRLLCYMAYLLAIYRKEDKKKKKVDLSQECLDKMEIPSAIGDDIRKMFGEIIGSSGKELKPFLTDSTRIKLTSYILVLAFFIEGFSYDCTQLARDLRLNPQQCVLNGSTSKGDRM
ncbi:DNA-directed RNA polymerase I subunit RPA49-like [Oscarella lobularis]|uniref:DNA-directed RNA polymerase I subunit RPA49-like n=1 Tax=Oscarella lobularis TaxID=121494 RepID=UPI0033133BFB